MEMPSAGRGSIRRMALWIITRRAQERAHSLKTEVHLAESSKLWRKHFSALSPSAVSPSESRYRLLISAAKIRQKSALVAYGGKAFVMGFEFRMCESITSPNWPEYSRELSRHAKSR